MNGLDMNPRIVGDRFASPRARQGGDARRWFTGITSGAVVLASGIIGMAPASAAPCGSATEFSGTYTVTVTGNCEWTPPALVTWADVVVVGGGGGGSGSYGDTTAGANTLLAGNGGGGGNIAFSTRVVVVPGTAISVTIGAGGTAGVAGGAGVGGAGGASNFGALSAAGGTGGQATDTTALAVKTGGSSGLTLGSAAITTQSGGSSFTAINNPPTYKWSLGGGGAGASGLAGASPDGTPLSCPTTGSVASSKPGCGGQGYLPVSGLFAGETTYYGGGGGGGAKDGYVVPYGGYGGGGVGDGRSANFGGTVNTGGGGGGARADAPTGTPNTPLSQAGGAGGSGIVVIKYAISPTVTQTRNDPLTSTTPATGTTSGGTKIRIYGTGFVTGLTVTIGGVSATGVSYSSGYIVAYSPGGTAGSASVVVTNPSGAQSDGGLGVGGIAAFVYVAGPPTVTSVSPASGSTSGGTSVTITGTGFSGATGVTIGGVAATGVTVVSATSITATTPAGSAGLVNVAVTTGSGTGTGTGVYTYAAPPTVTSVSPVSGSTAGGTAVTITGTGFVSGATVTVGGSAVTSVVFVSSTSLTAVTPTGAVGARDIVVTNPNLLTGTGTALYSYAVVAPTVVSLSPSSGSTLGATSVTITGTGFITGATVTIGGSAATSVVFVSSTSITAVTPAGSAGTANVVVTNAGGSAGTGTAIYTYVPPVAPTVTAVSPVEGAPAGGTLITITGTGFEAGVGLAVSVGGASATSVTWVSSTSLTAVTPAGAAGPAVAVSVTNPSTLSGTAAAAFTYAVPVAPAVTSIAPSVGSTGGGTMVTITGTGFVAGSGLAVTIGGVAATGVTWVNSTTITATAPAGTTGAKNVVVTNPSTLSGTGTGAFTYAVAPTVTSASPSSGTDAGGVAITITGTGFVSGATVTIGGAAATGVTWVSSTSITATAPTGSAGAQNVVVTNPSTLTGTAAGAFTFTSSGGGGSGGGSSGGGGASSNSTPETTPTATSTAVTPPVLVQQLLDPIESQANGNIPASGVPAGGSVFLVGGVPQAVSVVPNARTAPTGLVVSGEDWSAKLVGRGDTDDPLGLTEKSALILQSQQSVRARAARLKTLTQVSPVAQASGTGFMSDSQVKFYILPATLMGDLTTDKAGVFAGDVPVPGGIAPGVYTLQMNGFAPDGRVRSLSIGVIMKPAIIVTNKKAKAAVFFEVLSSVVTDGGMATLRALVKSTGKAGVSNLMVGFVQGTKVTTNDLTLSTQRAKSVAAYLRFLGLKGAYVIRGDGVAKQPGAAARRVNIVLEYKWT